MKPTRKFDEQVRISLGNLKTLRENETGVEFRILNMVEELSELNKKIRDLLFVEAQNDQEISQFFRKNNSAVLRDAQSNFLSFTRQVSLMANIVGSTTDE